MCNSSRFQQTAIFSKKGPPFVVSNRLFHSSVATANDLLLRGGKSSMKNVPRCTSRLRRTHCRLEGATCTEIERDGVVGDNEKWA